MCNHNIGIISNGTPNYNLPQWTADTVTSWLTQMNSAMLKIDTVLHGLAIRTVVNDIPEDIIADVENLNEFMTSAKNVINDIDEQVQYLLKESASQNTQLATLTQQTQTLTINYANCDTRLSTMEAAMQGMQASLLKLTENLNSLTERVQALEDK